MTDAERGEQVLDADKALVEGHPPPSARMPLSRDRVVAEALAYIDEEGPVGLTMRRVGTRLGVEAMALYRYVPSKEELLDAVVDALLEEFDEDAEVYDEPVGGWQDFLQRMAHGLRRVALAHPQAFPLMVSRPPKAPWLRPPLRSLSLVQTMIEALLSEGFDDRSVVAAYRAFSNFLLGHLLLEVSTLGADVGHLDTVTASQAPTSEISEFPTLVRLSGHLCQNHAAEEFEIGLEQLLDRLTLLRAEQGVTD